MKIVYASCAVSKNAFRDWFSHSADKPGQQVQKYHRLLAQGFALNGADVRIISAPPISRSNIAKLIARRPQETIDGVHYRYLPTINIPVIKNLIHALTCVFAVINECRGREVAVISDALNISVSIGALIASRITGKKSIGIVTDMPHLLYQTRKGLLVRLNNRIISSFAGYVFLTGQMNELINIRRKPHVVIEGMVDIRMKTVGNILENKRPGKISLYAGATDRKYGIPGLVDSFTRGAPEDARLHIYGSGGCTAELRQAVNHYDNIAYFSTVDNDEVVAEEIRATLLINPRPSNEEFTKYSFPSKNMEYMASGTPVLTTDLPGMPLEYRDYVYLFDDESRDGMAKTIRQILSKSAAELHEKGNTAKKFVLERKNNRIQAEKIIGMIQTKLLGSPTETGQ